MRSAVDITHEIDDLKQAMKEILINILASQWANEAYMHEKVKKRLEGSIKDSLDL